MIEQLPCRWPTVVHMLRDAAIDNPDGVAVECDGLALTYSELERCVRGFAGELRDAGAKGSIVLTVLDNSIELAIAMYAAHAAGAQLCPVNPRYTARELSEIVDDANPAVIVASTVTQDTLKQIVARADNVIVLGHSTDDWVGLWRSDHSKTLDPDFLPDDSALAVLQYTGGTTGHPKGVNLSHRQVAVNISQREAFLPSEPERESILCVMPLYHVFATAMCLHLAAACRSALHIIRQYTPDAVLDAVPRHGITILPAGPTVFIGLLSHEELGRANLSTLRLSYSGSSSLPVDVLTRWRKFVKTPIFEGYGQTEAGPVISYNSPLFPIKPGSVGKPLPLTEVEIVDPQNGTNRLPRGEIGEIRVRGPQVMSGYRNRPDETAMVLHGGWLFTGDLGYLDTEGYLFIRGRKKEMIIVSGFNVYPREIDEILAGHADVKEAATVGVSDARRGESPHAFVALRHGATVSAQDLLEHCRKSLAAYKVPATIHMVEHLPKTAVGKIDLQALQTIAADQ